ncbi:MAG: murein biosynthesis integral membrane protein MurJ [Thermoguttaceae bacterium]|nr:murein biosynthesis integral membrane protein MurJ [Thermoguttaceae bacterium]
MPPVPAKLSTENHDDNSRQVLFSGTVINAALTFISRILGMLRDVATAALFGVSGSVVFDAFVLAFRIPNLFRRLFGEGAVSISFLPVFCRQWKKNPESAWELLTAMATMLSAVLGLITLLGAGFCLGYLWLYPGERLAANLTLIMVPYMFLICQTAIFASALQGLKSWFAPALAPVIMNLLWLWAVVAIAPKIGGPKEQAYLLASVISLSAALQLALQLVALRKYGYNFQRCLFNRIAVYWRRATSGWVAMAVGLSLLQICVVCDTLSAWFYCPTGTVSSVFLAERLFEFPLGLIGISVATAVYPLFNQHAAEKNFAAVKKDMSEAVHLALFWGVPATAGLLLMGVDLCQLLFEHGHTTSDDTLRIGNILAIYGGGVWAYCLTPILTRGFYSIGQVRLPALVVVIASAVNLISNLILSRILPPEALQFALALTTVICVSGSTLVLGALWKLRVGGEAPLPVRATARLPETAPVGRFDFPSNATSESGKNKEDRKNSFISVLLNPKILCIIFATAIMMAAGKQTLASFPQDPSTTARLIKAFSTVFVCIIVYLGVMYFFWKPERQGTGNRE